MSNIAGKAYAMNLLTPISKYRVWINRFIFWVLGSKFLRSRLRGLITLSLIHYARWVIVGRKQFPWLGGDQPKENLHYDYMLFFSNFNGSWTQYVDSFSMAIPEGLNFLWCKNIGWPNAAPETPFNSYVLKNQIWTEHYYSAYPMASSNDVKSAQRVKEQLSNLCQGIDSISEQDFIKKYNDVLFTLQSDLSQMAPTPVVSLANEAFQKRNRIETQIN
jgi:hypothetical protein